MAGDVRGATAVEFGLVCVPFLALLGAILQVAFSIWAAQNFDFVFQKTARSLFTGQFQQTNSQSATAGTLLAALKTSMCGSGGSVTVFDCSGVKLDVSLGTNFASIKLPAPIDSGTRDWSAGFGTHYTCPGPGTIVVATAAAKFPVFFGLLNLGFSSFADGSQLLMSTAVFRTEPYSVGSGAPC
jgi:pilus assembly protein Flp/PilA